MPNHTKLKLVHLQDPHHGWLCVKIAVLRKLCKLVPLNEIISGYSYINFVSRTVWLEEDVDAKNFISAAKSQGWEVEIEKQYVDAFAAWISCDYLKYEPKKLYEKRPRSQPMVKERR